MLQLHIFHQRKSSSLGGCTRVDYPITGEPYGSNCYFSDGLKLNGTFLESFLISVILWTSESKSIYIARGVMGGGKNVLASI